MPLPTCRDCGLDIPANAPGGRCPHCLFSFALTPEPDVPGPDGGSTPATMRSPRRRILGSYELLEELASGGMGVVWKARQFGLNRLVALKMLHAGSLASAPARLRFRMEVEAVARLDHPNIVTFYEAGEDEGIHFYTMTLVETGTLASALAGSSGRPPLRHLVRMLVRICRAVEFAHRHGILHRDLKPSNILIDAHGEPLVADFGLARSLLPDSSLTASGTVLGSPHYMAPEQAVGNAATPSTATDVYSLGAILHECATGEPPFRAPTPLEVLDQVRRSDPSPPSGSPGFSAGLSRSEAHDLDTIVLKCLRKDPAARYASAAELADELERWLAGQPIAARPMGWMERSWRWCRREPARAFAVGTALALVAVTGAGLVVHTARMSTANGRIAAQASQLRDQNDVLRLREAESLFDAGESARAVATLATVVRSAPENSVAVARLQSALRLRAFPRIQYGSLRPPGPLKAEGWIGDRGVATISSDGVLRFWEANTGAVTDHVNLAPAGVSWAVIGQGGRVAAAAVGNSIHFALLDAGGERHRMDHSNRVSTVVIDPGERLLASADDAGFVRVWDTRNGQPVMPWVRSDSEILDCAVAASAPARLLILDAAHQVTAWEGPQGRQTWSRRVSLANAVRLVVSPDGARVAVAVDGRVLILEGADGRTVATSGVLPGGVNRMLFSPDSMRVAISSDGLTGDLAQVWDYRAGPDLGPALRHRDRITLLAFSRDGRRLLTGSHDRTASVWDVSTGQRTCEPMLHPSGLTGARFNPDDTAVLTSTFSGTVSTWRLPPAPDVVALALGEPVLGAVMSPDGARVAACGVDGAVKVWSIAGGIREDFTRNMTRRAMHVEFSPDGRRIAVACWDGTARVWDLPGGREVTLRHHGWSWVMSARFSPDGTRVLTAGHDRTARVWDAASGRELLILKHDAAVSDAVYSPDGRFLLTRGLSSASRLWDAQGGALISDRLSHSAWVDAVAFTCDGASILTASRDTTVKLWRWDGRWDASGAATALGEALVYEAPARIERAVLSADGRRIAAAVGGHVAALWDHGSRMPRHLLGHGGPVYDARFDREGGRVVTASGDRTARVWSTRTGQPMSEPLRHADLVYVAAFSPSDDRVMTAGGDGWVRLWPAPKPPVPAPGWLPKLAERMAALRGETGSGFQLPDPGSPGEMEAWYDRLRRGDPMDGDGRPRPSVGADARGIE